MRVPPIDMIINTQADPLTTLSANEIGQRDSQEDLLKTVTWLNSLKGLFLQVPSRLPGSERLSRLQFVQILFTFPSRHLRESFPLLFARHCARLWSLTSLGKRRQARSPVWRTSLCTIYFFFSNFHSKGPLCLARLCDPTKSLLRRVLPAALINDSRLSFLKEQQSKVVHLLICVY